MFIAVCEAEVISCHSRRSTGKNGRPKFKVDPNSPDIKHDKQAFRSEPQGCGACLRTGRSVAAHQGDSRTNPDASERR